MAKTRFVSAYDSTKSIARIFGPFRYGGSAGDALRVDYGNGYIEFRRNRLADHLSIIAGPPNGPVLVHCVLENIIKVSGDRQEKCVRITCASPKGRRTKVYAGSFMDPQHGFLEIQIDRFDYPDLSRFKHRRAKR